MLHLRQSQVAAIYINIYQSPVSSPRRLIHLHAIWQYFNNKFIVLTPRRLIQQYFNSLFSTQAYTSPRSHTDIHKSQDKLGFTRDIPTLYRRDIHTHTISQHKLGFRLFIIHQTYEQKMQAGEVTHTLHATRLAYWWSSLEMDWQAEWQPGVMADSPALIPLVGNNSRFDLLHSQMQIFIHYNVAVENQPFHLPMHLFIFLFIIYLQ